MENGFTGLREIVRTHVVGVKNFDGVKVAYEKGEPYLSEESLNNIDHEVISEIAGVIVQLGGGSNGEDRAFFSLGTSSRRALLLNLQLPANSARLENAKSTMPHSDLGQGETQG